MLKKTKRAVTAAAIAALSACVVMQCISIPSYSENVPSSETVAADKTNTSSIQEVKNGESLAKDYEKKETSDYYRVPADNDLVNVIVKLKGDGMLDFATKRGLTVPQAMTQFSAASEIGKYTRLQSNTQMALSGKFVSTGYRYHTIFNGFSAQVYYRDVAEIEKNKNVESVILSNTYLMPEEITVNDVNVHESTGIFNSEGVGFDGTGTVVAVLDTGTDYTHEVFREQPDEETTAIKKEDVAKVKDVLAATSMSAAKGDVITEDDLYMTSKLPYVYDYADGDTNVYGVESHGTHVAGIIAGKSEVITGVAPKAQIATFKVFSDYETGAETANILAGLNDAVALGVDAINMSLGSSCGFSREEDDQNINDIYDKVEKSGICLVVAASNDYSSAHGSTHGVNLASNPDSGTVGSPATYPAAMAVASVSGVKTKYVRADGEKEIYFTESNKVGAEKSNDFVAGLLGDNSKGEYDYIVVPGVGNAVNYSNIDVKGKIAVVKRGTINFEDKVSIAQSQGAVAVIVYNNVSGTISMSVGTKDYIPSCSVSMDFGNYLVSKGSGKLEVSKEFLAGPFMSDFSSWGVLPNLTLSPDITAHGGEIYSSVVGTNEYDKLSGTSMACPNLAGALILVREYVKGAMVGASTNEIRDVSYSRMMSTATIVKNEEGNPYSPRKQGAGIADMKHSVSSQAYLTVDGSNKPKLSLGDDPERTGVYTMSFNVVNVSSNTLTYDLDAFVMTESMSSDEKTVAEKAYMFTDSQKEYSVSGAASLSGKSLSVQPNGTATITVKISLSGGEKTYLDTNFKNGMYVEGYIRLLSKNSDQIDLNIPYLAFYGDWADAPMLDVTAYEVGESAVDTSVKDDEKLVADVYGTLPYSGFDTTDNNNNPTVGYWGMGAYSYIIPDGYATPVTREQYASLTSSKDGNYTLYSISAGLLRGAKRTNMQIRDSVTGELVWEKTGYNGRKAVASGGEAQGGIIEVGFDVSKLGLANNSRYVFSMECFLDWKDGTYGNRNTFSFEFSIDNEAPVLADYKVREEKSNGITRHYVDFYMYDNHYMQGYYAAVDPNKKDQYGNDIYDPIVNAVIPVYDGEYNGTTKVTLDVTAQWNHILENNGRLHLELIDYAKNSSEWDVQLKPESEVKVEKTRTARDGYSIQINGQMDLKTYIQVSTKVGDDFLEGYWNEDLVWASTDPATVEVRDGIITGKKEGVAIISVAPQAGMYSCKSDACKGKVFIAADVIGGKCPDCGQEVSPYFVNFNISVGNKETTIGLSGLKLSAEAVSLERGESITVTASIEPYNYKGTVNPIWSSTNEANVTVTVDKNNPFKATIRAVKSGGATIRVSAEGSFISAYCSVSVKQEYSMEGAYLRSYTGRGDENGVVEIPDDLGIVYIYPQAFFRNEHIKKVIIPAGVKFIMRAAFYECASLEEVVLPESLEEIQTVAFAFCEKLKSINLEHVH
ncbi:MAG: S8 family serine peptidase, partial [Clostridiales bacterium]|nr:S8 family serine peptidase [Clostridiales bacterium]